MAIGDERVSHGAALVRIEELEARITELETTLGEVLGGDVWDFSYKLAEGCADIADVERWNAVLKGRR